MERREECEDRGGSEEWIVGLGMAGAGDWKCPKSPCLFPFLMGVSVIACLKWNFGPRIFIARERWGGGNFRLAPKNLGLAAGEGILGRNFWN